MWHEPIREWIGPRSRDRLVPSDHPDVALLGTSHDVHMRVGRSGPHDVRAGGLVCSRQSGSLRIERPHNHPVRTYRYRRTRGVIRIGIASLRGTGKHVGNSRNAVRWLWFVSAKVRCPLHRCGIHAHRRLTDNVWIPRHTGEPVAALAQDHSIALRICIDDPCCIGDTSWAGRHRAGYFDFRRIAAARRRTLIRGSCLSRALEKHSSEAYRDIEC